MRRLARESPREPSAPQAAVAVGAAGPAARVLELQRAAGNHAVGRTLARAPAMNAPAERELDAKWQVKPSGVPKELGDALLAGTTPIAMTFYEVYDPKATKKKTDNDAEFPRAATAFAAQYRTLGLTSSETAGGALAPGRAIPVRTRDDVQQAVTSVHQTLHALADERNAAQRGKEGAVPVATPKIGTISIFAHGIREAIGLDPSPAETAWFGGKQIPAFVAAIRASVTADVRILVFACSAGASEGKGEGGLDEPPMPAPGEAGGAGSFAAQLAKELGGDATVFAHNIAAHTERNPFARVFDANSATGRQLFDVMYDAAFIAAESARLKAANADTLGKLSPAALAEKLRALMWSHFKGIVQSPTPKLGLGGSEGAGAAMFMDPEGTKTVLRRDFSEVYLNAERVKALAGS